MTPKRTKTVVLKPLKDHHCGSDGWVGIVEEVFAGGRGWMLRCKSCGKHTRWHDTPTDARAAWNRRTNRKGKK